MIRGILAGCLIQMMGVGAFVVGLYCVNSVLFNPQFTQPWQGAVLSIFALFLIPMGLLVTWFIGSELEDKVE